METLGEVSFSPPAGFKNHQKPAPTDGAANMTDSGPGWTTASYNTPGVPIPPGDFDRDFAAVWQRDLAKMNGREPSIDDRYDYREAGYPGRFGSGSSDRSGVVTLMYVLHAHKHGDTGRRARHYRGGPQRPFGRSSSCSWTESASVRTRRSPLKRTGADDRPRGRMARG